MTRDVRGVAGVLGAFTRRTRPNGGSATGRAHVPAGRATRHLHRPGRSAATPIATWPRVDHGTSWATCPPAPVEASEPAASSTIAPPTLRERTAVSRQALLRWVYEALDPAFEEPDEPSFDDVLPDHPSYRVVEWATAVGMLSGYPDGTFRPSSGLPNGTAVAILAKASLMLDAQR
jgi:hypothetical protein